MIRRALLAAVTAALVAAPAASAHVQVRPALAAPGDPVLFQVIVPNEKDAHTTEVTLQIPKDVIPFSFEEPEGWTRENKTGADGSLETVTWKGELAEDGFARFAFLASTPEQEGEIAWKAIQTYDDGSTSRWIGAPDSDNPAAVTTISADAPRENAGGEGAEAEAAASATAAPEQTNAEPVAATVEASSDSPLPLILSIVAVVLAGAALLMQLRRSR
ncbi:DUF1775 domain-containing protein [Solirubrobacter sp. CPCC 204708]|uniref:DUF1775 domain-containing protein n=1 Tax=Solirubrobacter deserti TaxID=2282478 RepID=A0ABT4RVJ8_9ACTN|nr:DUF1775 domain-containing protein [Solirubrobacter deserti]MBE2318922.1 DUF1775 domain-containing protein [Solirubrobacter deserti]MDA0142502.1 DUF1775 domain-containing protein [Solirubrobacter deserti]